MKKPKPIVVESKTTAAMLKVDQQRVVKTFGQRMREARDLCGFSQIKAAKLLGYANSSKLAKIEAASDTASVPLWVIPRAAEVYMVSTDFLFGISDDWEKDPVVSQQRQIYTGLLDHWERARAAELNAIRTLNNKLFAVSKAVSHGLKRSFEMRALVERIREINPWFDDELKLGAKLLSLAIETTEEAVGISAELKRYKAYVDVADRSANVNADIFDMDGDEE